MRKTLIISWIACTTVVTTIVLLAVLAQSANAQGTKPSTARCSVEVTSLRDGDNVGPNVTVRGTATIPADGYLWVLARKKSMGNQWWPQAGGAVEIDEKQRWEAEVFFGRPADIGSTFEIAAVVVNRQINEELVRWFATAKDTDYTPRPFPNSNPECQVVTIRVVKVK